MELWIVQPHLVADPIFMMDLGAVIKKRVTNQKAVVLHLSNATFPIPKIQMMGKDVSGFLTENLIANVAFELSQLRLFYHTEQEWKMSSLVFNKMLALSEALVLSNIYEEQVLPLNDILNAFQQANMPITQTYLFPQNISLNIHTTQIEELAQYPTEQEMIPVFETCLAYFPSLMTNVRKLS